MKVIFCLVVLLVASFTKAEEIKEEDGVLVLTKANWKGALEAHEYILVEFYAPWCGHCKQLAPEYAKAAKTLADRDSNIKLGKVDATEESELAEEFGVRGYPTLKFFRSGSPIEYSGGRTADDIVSWLSKKTGPAAKELESVEAAEEFLKDNNVAVVGFFGDRDSAEAKAFLATANSVDDYPFAITKNEEVYKKYEASCGKVILFKNFDEGKAVFDGTFDEASLKKFVVAQAMPLVVDFNHDSAQKIFGGEIKSHLLMFLSKENGDFEKYSEPSKEVAKKFREQILFVSINADEEDHGRILEFFGMKKEEVPSMRIIQLQEDMAKFKPDSKDLSPESIEAFVQKFLDGKLKQHLLSQELPEDWDKTSVKTLVATNFDEIAFDKNKDVFVEFYAPWCGHCKQLAPIFDQLGDKFKDSETVVVAKIDSTANELEHTKITSFPTIKLFKKGDNGVVDYNGERTLEGFTKFLESGGLEDAAGVADIEDVPVEDEKEAKDEL